ncbi:hypothetical protein [Erwinia phage vB_Ea277G]|jgi:hypothetical protein|nr:hypothetical protein [Erwinia phage vB_Ea277G]
MSIVLYHRGIIAADSRAIIDRGYNSEDLGAMLKLWDNEAGDMVLGMCGENTDFTTRVSWQLSIEPLVRALDVTDDVSIELPEYMHKTFGPQADRSMLVLTKRYLYAFDDTTLYKADTSHKTYGHGNGLRIAKMGAYNGLDAVAAVKLAIAVNPDCGGTVVSFKQRDLKLIPKPKRKKKDA